MPDERDQLAKLASSVADGGEPSGEDVGAAASGAESRLIDAFRLIARIRDVHRAAATSSGDDMVDASTIEAVEGRRWGPLVIQSLLGRGSFGEVFVARDTRLDRLVALKLLRVPADSGQRSVEEMLREGRLLARIQHRNVATVFGADLHDGRVGLWMELISGETLADTVRRRGALGAREAALIGVDVCRALAAVHARDILHRDVKAQNVMRAEGGRIVLMDFGIGREVGREDSASGSISGTPLYLAPEVLSGGRASVQSELYSLGALLFHLVTGRFPVEGRSFGEIADCHRRQRFNRLIDLRSDLPRALVDCIERAIAPAPEERFTSAGEMESALAAALRVEEVGTPRLRLSGAAKALLLALAAMVVLALGVVGARWFSAAANARRAAERSYESALRNHELGNLERAVGDLELCIEQDPDHLLCQARLPDYLAGLGRDSEALTAAARARLRDDQLPASERARLAATYYSMTLEYEKAIEAYEDVLRHFPGDADAYLQIAMIEANRFGIDNRGHRAVERAEEAVRLQPKDAIYRGVLASIHAEFGDPAEALRVLADLEPGLAARPYIEWPRGFSHLVAGEREQAVAAFDRLIASDAEDILIGYGYLYKATSLIVAGQLKQAAELLWESLPNDVQQEFGYTAARRRILRARLFLLLDEPGRAQRELDSREVTELETIPTNLRSLRDAALIQIELGNLEAARRLGDDLRGIAAAYPGHLARASAATVAGHLAAARGHKDEALRLLAEDAFLEWPGPVVLRSLASLWMERGEWAQARFYLLKILEMKGRILDDHFPGDWVVAHLDLARCEVELENPPDASRRYREFLDLWREGDATGLVRAAGAELERLQPGK